jgi:hypothetical protein
MRAYALIALTGLTAIASAQPQHAGHHGRSVLFLAEASADQLPAGGPQSAGTATAAVVVDKDGRGLRYDLTYHGLERGSPGRIALYNFGRGGVGRTIVILCGQGDHPCPSRPSARFTGDLPDFPLPGELLSEFASGRIYLQIDGGDGQPEIRGQLETNGAMVASRNYIAPLSPTAAGASGEGTAVLSETYLPDGEIAVEYSVTVAGTVGAPQSVALIAGAPAGALRFTKSNRLPAAFLSTRDARRSGGTVRGRYVAKGRNRPPSVAAAMLPAQRVPSVVVSTSRFPRGELAGVLAEVE